MRLIEILVISCTFATVQSDFDVSFGCRRISLKNGRARYRKNSIYTKFLCNPGYILAGERYIKCINKRLFGSLPKCVTNTCKKTSAPMNGFLHTSHRGGVLNFDCKVGYEFRGETTIYCDGQSWSSHMPTCIESNRTVSVTCDFEREDMCGWTHDINHDFDWTRHKLSTPTGNVSTGHVSTGPRHDHTPNANGSGYYMYTEASSRSINDTARLISPAHLKQTNNTCLEFYYHMYGFTIGELRVYVKKISDSDWNLNPEDAIVRIVGNHGNHWLKSITNLGTIDDEFQIIIEAIRGRSFMSDIAIDDVRLIENCVESDYAETISTTESTYNTDYGSEIYETCTGKCETADHDLNCMCMSGCELNDACCPDYVAVCGLVSYDANNDFNTDEMVDTTETYTTAPPEKPVYTTVANFSIRETTPTYSITPKKIVTRPTTINPTTKVVTQKSTTLRTTTTKLQTTGYVSTIPTTPTQHYESSEDDYGDMDNIVPFLDDAINSNMATTQTPLKENSRTYTFIIISSLGVFCAAIISATCFMKRQSICLKIRHMKNSSHGDSQSDVRFLTSDEILDFSLATPAY